MATLAGDLMADIDLRYRNSFTPQQKAIWMNDEQNDIFSIFKIDIGPINFPLQTGVQFYPLPVTIQYIEQIRTVTIQVSSDATNPDFMQLPYRRDDDGVLDPGDYWYTLVGQDTIFINIPPTDTVDNYQVYMFLDGAAAQITDSTSPVSVPQKYLEILKYGVLRRISEARRDTIMQKNYDASRNEIIQDMLWTTQVSEPSWITPVSTLPIIPKFIAGRYGAYQLQSLSGGAGNGPTSDNTWDDVAYNPWNTVNNMK
jgi:hypothetical protein